ncbi:MAG TPA: hypothetical protein VLC79_06260 [Cellvibrio sp.]|nr:hypothetical protein [Cellvibrio sp.]
MFNPLRLMTVLAFLVIAGQAGAQTANSSSNALDRFIGSDGLGLSTVKRSDLDELWGRADSEKPTTASPPSRERGTWLVLEYKSLGLMFTTTPGSYGSGNPQINSAYFSTPFKGCTPQGLCMGMPQEAALTIISAQYKITFNDDDYYSASNRGWRTTHYMSFSFKEGRLHSMQFQLIPSPLLGYKERSLLFLVFLLAVIIGVERVLRPYRRQVEPVRKMAKIGCMLYLVISALVGLFVFYILLNTW